MDEEIRLIDPDKHHPRLRVSLDVIVASPEDAGPSIIACRHAVLTILTHGHTGYVIYDRLLNRIIDGVYYMSIEEVLEQADAFNDPEWAFLHENKRAPNGDAMGLVYPTRQ